MKVSIVLAVAACAAAVTALPPPGGFMGGTAIGAVAAAPFMPSPEMIQAFIPTPKEIAALNALHTTLAPGVLATTAAEPTVPPTMPPAIANLVNKYKDAAAAFTTPSPPVPVV